MAIRSWVERVAVVRNVVENVVIIQHIPFPLVIGVGKLWQLVEDVARRLVLFPVALLEVVVEVVEDISRLLDSQRE